MRRIGLVIALLAIVGIGLWTWNRSRHVESVPANVVESSRTVDPSPARLDEPSVPIDRASAAVATPPNADTAATTNATALVKVLVVERTSGRAVVDARVTASHENAPRPRRIVSTKGSRGGPFQELHTDPDGRVEIEAPVGVELSVYASGTEQDMGSQRATVPPLAAGVTHELRLQLPSGDDLAFWVRFVDADTRAPIVDGRLTESGGRGRSFTTNARGLVEVRTRSWSQTPLRFSSTGHSPCWLMPVESHDREEAALEILVPRSATLRVRVLDAAGAPVAGRVLLAAYATDLLVPSKLTTTSVLLQQEEKLSGTIDSSGQTTIVDVPPRAAIRAQLVAMRQAIPMDLAPFAPGEVRDVVWKPWGTSIVRGRVVVEGTNEPVANREVCLFRDESTRTRIIREPEFDEVRRVTRTDAQGAFEFDACAPGQWTVGLSPPKPPTPTDDLPAYAVPVTLHDGDAVVDVTLRVPRGLYVRGRVVDPDGKPAVSVQVSGIERTSRSFVLVTTGADGAFAFGPLVAGRFRLSASYGSDSSAAVEAVPGDDGVVLRLRRGTRISGRVVDESGNPVVAQVTIAAMSPTRGRTSFPSTKPDGTYESDGCVAGSYSISAATSDGRIGSVPDLVVTGEGPVVAPDIRLARGGFVRIFYDGESRYATFEIRRGESLFGLTSFERGTTYTMPAPVGSMKVKLRDFMDSTRDLEQAVDVRPGETADVSFDTRAK